MAARAVLGRVWQHAQVFAFHVCVLIPRHDISTPCAAIVIALAVLLGPSSDAESVHCPGAAPQSTMADWTSASFRGDGDLLYMSAGLDESTPGAFDVALKC